MNNKFMKLLCLAMIVMFSISLVTIPVMAEQEVKVLLNGEELSFDIPPRIIDDRTMVPMRVIFEALGADVYWIDMLYAEQTILAVKNEIKIFMTIDINELGKAIVDDFSDFANSLYEEQTIILDVPPMLIDGRTLVPLRAVGEALGVEVDWSETTNTVTLTYDGEIIKNTDHTFYDELIAYIGKQFAIPYNYYEVETSPFVPEGIKELCRQINSMTNAVEIAQIILDKYGNPTKNYMDSPMFIMPVWEVDGGELSLVFFQGVTFSNEYGTWNLLPVHSRFSEVWRSELDVSTEWGYYGDNTFISAIGVGTLLLYDDGVYEFQLYEGGRDDSDTEDFIENAFFSRHPAGTWEIRFENNYNYDTDINLIRMNTLIATVYFTSDNGDRAELYVKKSDNGLDFGVSEELKCQISSYSIPPPFDIDSIFGFI